MTKRAIDTGTSPGPEPAPRAKRWRAQPATLLCAAALCLLLTGLTLGEGTQPPDNANSSGDAAATAPDAAGGADDTTPEQVPLEQQLGDARSAMDRWVENERLIAELRRDTALRKELLREHIAVLEQQIAETRERIREAEGEVEKAGADSRELEEKNDRLIASEEKVKERLLTYESQMRDLLDRLPAGVRGEEAIEKLAQRLPTAEKPDKTQLPTPQRYLTVTGILSELDKYNLAIHMVPETFARGGEEVEVTAVYIGVGQGYYLEPDSGLAGIGTATAGAWTWQNADHLAPRISQAMAIWSKKDKPAFVTLPVEVFTWPRQGQEAPRDGAAPPADEDALSDTDASAAEQTVSSANDDTRENDGSPSPTSGNEASE